MLASCAVSAFAPAALKRWEAPPPWGWDASHDARLRLLGHVGVLKKSGNWSQWFELAFQPLTTCNQPARSGRSQPQLDLRPGDPGAAGGRPVSCRCLTLGALRRSW